MLMLVLREAPILVNASNAGMVYLLYGGTCEVMVTRVGARTLELRPAEGWMPSPLDRMARSSDLPFVPDQWVALEQMGVEVFEVTEDGRPEAARFVFRRALDEIGWVAWDGETVAAWEPPQLGQTIVLRPRLFGM